MPRTFKSMVADGKIQTYLAMLPQAMDPLIPVDARFLIVVFDPVEKLGHFASSRDVGRSEVIEVLGGLLDSLKEGTETMTIDFPPHTPRN